MVSRSGASLCISVAGGDGGGRGGGRAGQAGRLQHVRCAADRQRLAPLTAAVNQGAWLTACYCCWVWLPAAEYHHRLVAFPAALCTTPRRRWAARWASRPSACRSSLWRRTAKVSQGRGAELSTAASHGAQLSSGRVADAGRRLCIMHSRGRVCRCLPRTAAKHVHATPLPLPLTCTAHRLADDREDPGKGAVVAGRVCGHPRGGEPALGSDAAAWAMVH